MQASSSNSICKKLLCFEQHGKLFGHEFAFSWCMLQLSGPVEFEVAGRCQYAVNLTAFSVMLTYLYLGLYVTFLEQAVLRSVRPANHTSIKVLALKLYGSF